MGENEIPFGIPKKRSERFWFQGNLFGKMDSIIPFMGISKNIVNDVGFEGTVLRKGSLYSIYGFLQNPNECLRGLKEHVRGNL